jgi:ssDNA-binding Zn-finger/Zn-ribbon topoisomerase 1
MIPDTPLEAFGLLVVVMVVYLMTSLIGKPAEFPTLSEAKIDHSRLACPSCGVISLPLRARAHEISAFSLAPKAFVKCGQCEHQWLQRPKDQGRCPQCQSADNPSRLDEQPIDKHYIARRKHCLHEWLKA